MVVRQVADHHPLFISSPDRSFGTSQVKPEGSSDHVEIREQSDVSGPEEEPDDSAPETPNEYSVPN